MILVARYLLLVAGYSLLVTCYWLLVTGYSLLVYNEERNKLLKQEIKHGNWGGVSIESEKLSRFGDLSIII